jgi:H+/Cl- antiporter ClcA
MGELLIIVGFLIGCYGGCVLSLPHLINDATGKASLAKQSKFAIIIVIGSLMVLAGQYIMTSPYSY